MKKFFLFMMIFSFLLFLILPVRSANVTPVKGEAFPDIRLTIPDKAGEREYLGITGKGNFKLSQIKADLIILEIFSMYCPYCQKEAPIVNDLFHAINKRAYIKDRIRIVGVGAGNTAFEVDVFRNQFNVPFALSPDESYAVHKVTGEVRTPYFFVIKKNSDGTNKIIYSKVGSIQDPNQFLDMIVQDSGLKQEAIK